MTPTSHRRRSHPSRVTTACRWREQAESAALDPSSTESAAFLAHTSDCAECRTALGGAHRTLAALRALPPVEGRDITAAVIASLPAHRVDSPLRRLLHQPLLRAAAVALAAGVGLSLLLRSAWQSPDTAAVPLPPVADAATPADARREAAEWLAAAQQPDGTWDVSALGGRDEHAPALAALALMALQDQANSLYEPALRKGATALLAMQRATGCFGKEGSFQMYNHGIATVALLRLQASGVLESPHEPLERAVAFIRSAQQPEGGWGYQPGSSDDVANASVTAWQLQALGLARQAGAGDPQGHLRRGLFWLSRLADARGVVGYQRHGDQPSSKVTTTAMGVVCLLQAGNGITGAEATAKKMARSLTRLLADTTTPRSSNPYRDFFAARASDACATGTGKGNTPDLTALRKHLVETRVASGATRGTWDPSDSYAQVGGRLYTTSLSAMALR